MKDSPAHRINFNIQNSIFQKNKADVSGGAIMFSRIFDYLQFNMDSVNFEDNKAQKSGGALTIIGEGKTTSEWTECIFLFNRIVSSHTYYYHSQLVGGSVLFSNQSIETLQLKKGKISGNLLDGFFARGSTINLRHTVVGKVTLEEMLITENIANSTGSCVLDIHVTPMNDLLASVLLILINSKLHNNTGTYDSGGHIFADRPWYTAG